MVFVKSIIAVLKSKYYKWKVVETTLNKSATQSIIIFNLVRSNTTRVINYLLSLKYRYR